MLSEFCDAVIGLFVKDWNIKVNKKQWATHRLLHSCIKTEAGCSQYVLLSGNTYDSSELWWWQCEPLAASPEFNCFCISALCTIVRTMKQLHCSRPPAQTPAFSLTGTELKQRQKLFEKSQWTRPIHLEKDHNRREGTKVSTKQSRELDSPPETELFTAPDFFSE